MAGVATMWLDAEEVGEHVHVIVTTGRQYGQDDFPHHDKGPGFCNDAGGAGTLIFRLAQWGPFIRSLAAGGHATGLRVIWRCQPDPRTMWNGAPDVPCFLYGSERTTWEYDPEESYAGR